MDASQRIVRLYFDYISPNAYLAWTQLPALAARYDFAIEPVPVLFAGLLEASGQLGPAEVPAKMRWMTRNNLRKAALLGVALEPPAFHPFNPLLALRVSSLALEPSARWPLVDALFRAVWANGLHVSDAAVIERVATEVGLDGAALVASAQHADCKARLREQTERAIARGIFGVPTMEAGDEIFWGYDDFPHLELCMAGRDPLEPSVWAKWSAAPRPSAIRRRSNPESGTP